MMGVYFLMGNYMVYMSQVPHGFQPMANGVPPYANVTIADRSELVPAWLMQSD
jgi:hypothetical protein